MIWWIKVSQRCLADVLRFALIIHVTTPRTLSKMFYAKRFFCRKLFSENAFMKHSHCLLHPPESRKLFPVHPTDDAWTPAAAFLMWEGVYISDVLFHSSLIIFFYFRKNVFYFQGGGQKVWDRRFGRRFGDRKLHVFYKQLQISDRKKYGSWSF